MNQLQGFKIFRVAFISLCWGVCGWCWTACSGSVSGSHEPDASTDEDASDEMALTDLNESTQNEGDTVAPTPCVSGGNERVPPLNYVFYDWENGDYNSLHPQGAPWGSVAVIPWRSVHVGQDQYNWDPIEAYLAKADGFGKAVMLEILPYESDLPGKTPIPAGVFPCTADEIALGKTRIFPMYYDLTPDWLRDQMGGSYYFRPVQTDQNFCVPQDQGTDICHSVAVMPKYDDPRYMQALKEFILAFGAKYNSDSRVAGVIFAQGLDAEFGEFTKGMWGDCRPKDSVPRDIPTFNEGKYLTLFVKEGHDNDYTDWYAQAFPQKPLYHQVTGGGKSKMSMMMAQNYPNLGIKQASILPDHNWFMDIYNQGILDIVMPWAGKAPVAWENPYGPRGATEKERRQWVYAMFLPLLTTFPDFFDFLGICFDVYIDTCTWAKQYYGRTPANTCDVWIAFQQSVYDPATDPGSTMFHGWLGDWEYGLRRNTTKGQTLMRDELVSTFGLQVANGYSGQARKVDLNEKLALSPTGEWKGIGELSSFQYELEITYIDNLGKIKVEVGSDADGWYTEEWDRQNAKSWQKKLLAPNRKARIIRITPTAGDPLYLHMVRLTLK